MKKVLADYRAVEVHIIVKPFFRTMERQITVVIKGIKTDGQGVKIQKIFAEQVGVFGQRLAVLFVAGFLQLGVGRIERLGHDVQTILPEQPPVIEGSEAGVRYSIISLRLKDVKRSLHFLLRGQSAPLKGEGIGPAGILPAVQLRHTAGNFHGIHATDSFLLSF